MLKVVKRWPLRRICYKRIVLVSKASIPWLYVYCYEAGAGALHNDSTILCCLCPCIVGLLIIGSIMVLTTLYITPHYPNFILHHTKLTFTSNKNEVLWSQAWVRFEMRLMRFGQMYSGAGNQSINGTAIGHWYWSGQSRDVSLLVREEQHRIKTKSWLPILLQYPT